MAFFYDRKNGVKETQHSGCQGAAGWVADVRRELRDNTSIPKLKVYGAPNQLLYF